MPGVFRMKVGQIKISHSQLIRLLREDRAMGWQITSIDKESEKCQSVDILLVD